MRTGLCYSPHDGIQWLASLAYDPLIDSCAVARTLWTLLDFYLSFFSPSFVWDVLLAQHLVSPHNSDQLQRTGSSFFKTERVLFRSSFFEDHLLDYELSVKSKVASVEWSV